MFGENRYPNDKQPLFGETPTLEEIKTCFTRARDCWNDMQQALRLPYGLTPWCDINVVLGHIADLEAKVRERDRKIAELEARLKKG